MYLTQKLEQHRLTLKYDILCSFVPIAKHYHVNYMDDNDKQLKTTCQWSIVFVRCSVKSGEVIYINFLHLGMSTLGLYP